MTTPRSDGPIPAPGPLSFREVLWEELRHLGRHDGREPAPPLEAIYKDLGNQGASEGLTGLCLSGGGIRSATFNLGVMQALARLGLLEKFDYLSSVSGGGFIAAWFKAWAHRESTATAVRGLGEPAKAEGFEPLSPEPGPVRHLREFSNYLTPRASLFSADTWTALALVARNLFLNWLVLVPALAALVAIPQVTLIIAAARHDVPAWFGVAPWLALAAGAWASAAANYFRLRRDRPASEGAILWVCVAPLWLAALLLSLAALRVGGDDLRSPLFPAFCVLWSIGMPVAGGLAAHLLAGRQKGAAPFLLDFAAIAISGGIAAVVLIEAARRGLPWLQNHPPLFVILTAPLFLGLYLLARSFYVAIVSLGVGAGYPPDDANADREWWARLSAWALIAAVGWMATSALVVLGGFSLGRIRGRLVAATGGLSGLLTALLGASPRSGRTPDAPAAGRRLPSDWALMLLAPVTVACTVIALANLNASMGGASAGLRTLFPIHHFDVVLELPAGTTLMQAIVAFSLGPLVLGPLLSWILGWVINVNVFSAQGLYRNRLVRAYLGASRPVRHPDPFTGFDPEDNLRLADLAHGRSPRPLPVINATLNLTSSSEKLAWQQRKAESFTLTPLHCGSFRLGYRPSDRYGGASGITLGAAMTISGAAANPNSGYHSSPLVAFLMTLFNVRLGSWLGNPGPQGERAYRRSGPRHAWKPLFGDLFGLTDGKRRYVSLSDGGHFENLGLYEMVLRRCRHVVVSDAGHDPAHSFEDLGNLIRKVRIDLGIPIEFDREIRILCREPDETCTPAPEGKRRDGLACALGTIRYDLVDSGAAPGRLLYIKPTLRAGPRPVPYDVFGYARTSDQFPHEPTSDQWFSEAQFESYRALGQHLTQGLVNGQPPRNLPALFAWIATRPGYTRPRDLGGRRQPGPLPGPLPGPMPGPMPGPVPGPSSKP